MSSPVGHHVKFLGGGGVRRPRSGPAGRASGPHYSPSTATDVRVLAAVRAALREGFTRLPSDNHQLLNWWLQYSADAIDNLDEEDYARGQDPIVDTDMCNSLYYGTIEGAVQWVRENQEDASSQAGSDVVVMQDTDDEGADVGGGRLMETQAEMPEPVVIDLTKD